MDKMMEVYQHRDLAAGRWAEMSFSEQMANIGSEISRANRAKQQNNLARAERAFFRALELFDLSIAAAKKNATRLKELCRAREEACDYFMGENVFGTKAGQMQKYYDQFVSLSR